MEKATFAAGCFWGVEHAFAHLPGVSSAVSGYIGGITGQPTYEEVCRGGTNHAEAVEVIFNPTQISYAQLLTVFWNLHDPTQLNRQGPDIGTQYRSAIFVHSSEQRQQAEASKATAQSQFAKPIVTDITDATPFWPAEAYHQQYFAKRGIAPTCH